MMALNGGLWFGVALGVWTSAVLGQSSAKLMEPMDGGSPLTVSVVNLDLEPVSGATVELLNWTGRWEPTAWNGTTTIAGEVAFDRVVLGYGSVMVSHPDYAVVMHDLSIEAATGATPPTPRHLRVKLAPAVTAHVNLVGPDGKPVTDAQIGFLRVTHPELDLSMALTAEMFERFGSGRNASDSAGRLALPRLPAGSVVQIQAQHAELAPVAMDQYRLSVDATPTLTMARGAQLEVRLAGDLVDHGELENVGVSMRLFSDAPGIANRIMHKFPVVDGKFSIGVHKLDYRSLYLQGEDLFITPTFDAGLDAIEDLKLTSEVAVLHAKVRRTHPIRGRVVDQAGRPVANTALFFNAVNEIFDADSDSWKPHSTRPWATVDYVQTSEDGYFQAKLPIGRIQVTVNDGPCFFEETSDFQVDYRGEASFPDIRVRRLPEIRVTIRNEDQAPVPRAIVRIVGQIQQRYYSADERGQVTIPLTERPRDENHEQNSDSVELLAFDPYSALAGTCRVDIRDPAACDDCQIQLEPRPLEWPHQTLQARNPRLRRLQESPSDANQPFLAEYPLASVGTPVDPLVDGVWSGSSNRSLRDFRGQAVLLDFWFMGCGPCQRELPFVKLAHDLYHERGFSVVSVHISGIPADQVQQYAQAQDMRYPLVVDPSEGPISAKYKKHGVFSYPTYILLDRDGAIASHSSVSSEPNLRLYLLETVRLAVLQGTASGSQ